MSSANAINIACEPLRFLDGGNIPIFPLFAPLTGPAGQTALEQPARMNIVNNFTNGILFLSIDGINPHFIIAVGASMVLDWSSNKSDQAGLATVPKGTTFYAAAGGVVAGGAWVSSVYASDNLRS